VNLGRGVSNGFIDRQEKINICIIKSADEKFMKG
jgi:hypothetical protein